MDKTHYMLMECAERVRSLASFIDTVPMDINHGKKEADRFFDFVLKVSGAFHALYAINENYSEASRSTAGSSITSKEKFALLEKLERIDVPL